jgi:hypothetical protein
VDNCEILDASHWMRAGILREGVTHAGVFQWLAESEGTRIVRSSIRYQVDATGQAATLRLIYTSSKTGEPLNYPIHLQTTRPHRGGLRWWFTCPLVLHGEPCGRRVQKLYLPPGGQYFGCRHCYHLGYDSRNKGTKFRARKKTQKIRMRLGGTGSLYDSFPDKPPRMWWRTYRKLQLQAERAESQYWALREPL